MPKKNIIIYKKGKQPRAQKRFQGKQPGKGEEKTTRALLEITDSGKITCLILWTEHPEGMVGTILDLGPELTRELTARARRILRDHNRRSRARSQESAEAILRGMSIAKRIKGSFLLRQAEILDRRRREDAKRRPLDGTDYRDLERTMEEVAGSPKTRKG